MGAFTGFADSDGKSPAVPKAKLTSPKLVKWLAGCKTSAALVDWLVLATA